MSDTATLTQRATTYAYSSGFFGIKPTFFRKDGSKSLFVNDVAVFRSGTFRDSMGIQNTWEKLHIDQMIANWDHLQTNKIFTDVPIRDGHPGWLIHGLPGNGKTIGYHTSLKTEKRTAPHDNVEYDYILAGFEITDPEAQQNIENGTWRSLSSEIGSYLSNAEAEFWPVYLGVAYVDIPAVEGLKFTSPNGSRIFDLGTVASVNSKETGVSENSTQTTPPAQQLPFASDVRPHVFSVNGAQTSDPVAVQNHITALELFRSETVSANRADFVTSLAAGNKILASQVESLTAFAQSLSPEQFAQWCKSFETAGQVPAVTPQAGAVTNQNNGAQSGATAQDEQYSIWEDTVLAHRMAGTPVDKIKETGSYKSLVAAGRTPQL